MKTKIIWASIAILFAVPLRAQTPDSNPSAGNTTDVAAMQQQIRDLQDRLIALEGVVRMLKSAQVRRRQHRLRKFQLPPLPQPRITTSPWVGQVVPLPRPSIQISA